MSVASDIASKIANEYSIRMEQQIRVCIKPKPRFITQNIWLKLAALFIYIEKTQPSMTITNPNGDKR